MILRCAVLISMQRSQIINANKNNVPIKSLRRRGTRVKTSDFALGIFQDVVKKFPGAE